MEGRRDESFAREWRRLFAAWRRLLAQCAKKPGRKCVHELRIATLRLQALMEFGLQGWDSAPDAVKQWNKQAGKLRRALQKARTPEVYLRKLDWLRGQADFQENLEADGLRKIAVLERRFARQRQAAEKKLVEEIGKRRMRLERWGGKVEGAIAFSLADGSGATVIGQQMAGLAAEFPVPAAENLHSYRKRVKNLRYLAEFFAAREPLSGRQARALAGMQAAIGEWRDWQLLAREAARVLKEPGALANLLEAMEGVALRKALVLCRGSRARLLRQNVGKAAASNRITRKIPARRVEFSAEKNSAVKARNRAVSNLV